MKEAEKVSLSGIERKFDKDELIVSKTDLAGKIVYGNRLFFSLAGYPEGDCLGKQHNLVRHPYMPRAIFDLLWETIHAGQELFAYVVNRCANGDHYWVFAHVTPSFDGLGAPNGYHSSRRVANPRIVKEVIEPLYKKLRLIESNFESPKEGLQNSREYVDKLLRETNQTFNEYMFALEKKYAEKI